jgi:hypothetical protein
MTTEIDELEQREQIYGKAAYTQGVYSTGFQDPSGIFPRASYFYQSSINLASRGAQRNDLSTNGGIPTLTQKRNYSLSSEIPEEVAESELDRGKGRSRYPYNQVWETAGGHVIELDDTRQNERILIKHATGAGIEIKPDGTVFISSVNDVHLSTKNDLHAVVEGNANWTYNGDLNVRVSGDYNLEAGNYTRVIASDELVDIGGANRTTVGLNQATTVKGHQSNTVSESQVDTVLGGYTAAIKGNYQLNTDGEMGIFASGSQRITSEVRQNMTSPDTNIHATNLSVFGDQGTFGGENIVGYLYNLHLGHTLWAGDGEGGAGTINVDTIRAVRVEVDGDINVTNSVTAPTFHGDLDGVANEARQSRHQLYGDPAAGGGVGSPGAAITNNAINTDVLADDTKATAVPNAAMASSYQQSAYGIQKVKVDDGGELKRMIDRSTDTGGVTNKQLTTSEVRSKLRDNNNLNNTDFTATQVAEGKLNPSYSSPNPPKIGRIADKAPTITENNNIVGPEGPASGPR